MSVHVATSSRLQQGEEETGKALHVHGRGKRAWNPSSSGGGSGGRLEALASEPDGLRRTRRVGCPVKRHDEILSLVLGGPPWLGRRIQVKRWSR